MAHDVFLSHREEDRKAAARLCAALEAQRISCWIAPRDIQPGHEWAAAIVDGLQHCRAFVLMLSGNCGNARQIGRELELADRLRLPIVTFRIEDVQPPAGLAYFIENVQWIDAFGDQFDSAVAQLAALAREADAPPAPPKLARKSIAPLMLKAVLTVLLLTILSATSYSGARMYFQTKSQNQFQDGKKCYDSGQRQNALALFNSALRSDDRNSLAYSYRAMIWHQLGDEDRALADAEAAVHLNPKWPLAFRVRADIHAALGQYQSAFDDYSSAIRINSADTRGVANIVTAYQGRAVVDRQLHRLQAAEKDEQTARRLAATGNTASGSGLLAEELTVPVLDGEPLH